MTIGLLGGTFNPPHDGHRHISLEAMRRLGLDRVWWLVTPGNPLKDHDGLAPMDQRAKDCASVANHPKISITTIERKIGSAYTANTVEHITRRARGTTFVWLMGGDNLAGFHKWDRWQDISTAVAIAVLDRPGTRHKALSSPAAKTMASSRLPSQSAHLLPGHPPPVWTFLDIPLSGSSSTALRARREAD